MDRISAPEQNRILGGIANLLRKIEQDSGPEFLPKSLDVMGLVRQLALPSAETVEKLSYGDPLFRMPTQSNIPITTDRGYLAEVLGMAPVVPAASRATTRISNEMADQLVRAITRNPEATAPGVLEETAMPFMQAVTPRSIGSGLSKIKEDAKILSEKEFLDKYVTQTLPEHLTSKNFPSGVKNQQPHEFLPPKMLEPSEWDDWSDRSMVGTAEKVTEFRKSLREGAEFPPILIHTRSGDFPYVEDGHHRMAAYLDEGYKSVPVSFDISSLIKIWKEENESAKKVSEIYKEYTQGLLSEAPESIKLVDSFLRKAQSFPSDYTDIAPRQSVVEIEQLIPTQKKVSQSAVDAYKSGQGSMGDLPVDVVFDTKSNQYLVVDGHHRVAAMIESGVGRVPVQIIGEK